MSKKNFFIVALQIVVISAFFMIAAGSGSDPQKTFDGSYEIGHGIGTLINN